MLAAVGIDIATGVARIEDVIEVLAVVRTRGASLKLGDHLVLGIDVDRELIAEVVLAVLLRPGGIDILLAPLRGLPVCGHCLVLDQLVLVTAIALLGRRHQRGIDDLTAARNKAPIEPLHRDAIKVALAPASPIRFSKVQTVVRSGTLVALASPQKRL